PPEHHLIHRNVIDDERAQATHLRRQRLACDERRTRTRQHEFEPECRALLDMACDVDLSTHQLDDLLADRKAETRSAEAAGHRAIHLTEFFEETTAHLLRHTDAGIRNLEAQRNLPLFRPGNAVNLKRNAALLGELDAVADKIEQNLTQPRRIALID